MLKVNSTESWLRINPSALDPAHQRLLGVKKRDVDAEEVHHASCMLPVHNMPILESGAAEARVLSGLCSDGYRLVYRDF